MITSELLLDLIIILVAAWALGTVFKRNGLPFIMGQLLAGLILGPSVLGLLTPSDGLELLAELGIFFVMFHSGMEMDPKEAIEHRWPSHSR